MASTQSLALSVAPSGSVLAPPGSAKDVRYVAASAAAN
jgi:hypothetical protein